MGPYTVFSLKSHSQGVQNIVMAKKKKELLETDQNGGHLRDMVGVITNC